jgi:hypothetical protein
MAASYDLAHEGSVPGSAGLAWLAANLWYAGLLSIPYLLTRFPDGRPLSSRWRVVDLLAALLLVDVVVVSLEPGRLPDYPRIENPLGVGPLAEPARVFEAVGLGLFVCYLVLAASSVVVRFRRSDGVERLQLKWLAFTVSSTAVVWLASMLVDSGWVADVVWTLGYLGLSCIPVSIGVAVLRYRLYEIDRLISRTLVYAAVTVVLAATYVALVLGGEAAFASFTGGSHLAIAVSTLVVAALFLPVRARMQRLVDRRFYRRRYDAQRTLETFGSRLREQLDLETLAAETVAVVTETMEPETTSLWLRKQAVR